MLVRLMDSLDSSPLTLCSGSSPTTSRQRPVLPPPLSKPLSGVVGGPTSPHIS